MKLYFIVKYGDAYEPIHSFNSSYHKWYKTKEEVLADYADYSDFTAAYELDTESLSFTQIK